MSSTLTLQDGFDKARFLLLQPGTLQDGIRLELVEQAVEAGNSFEVVECHPGSRETTDEEAVSIDGQQSTVARPLYQALKQLRKPDSPRTLWIDQLCVNQDDMEERRHIARTQLRQLHQYAAAVYLWAGEHDEEEDTLRHWIGPGSPRSTQEAFRFAHELSEATPEGLPAVLDMTAEGHEFPSRCHFARILYRPWFQQLPITRKRYSSDLSNVTVLCSSEQISWKTISAAAARLHTIQPLPYIFSESYSANFRKKFKPCSIHEWFNARDRFGFDFAKTIAQLHRCSEVAPEAHKKVIFVIVGVLSDKYDWDSYTPRFLRYYKKMETTGDPYVTLERAGTQIPSPTFTGSTECPPLAADQKDFAHNHLNDGYIRLLVLQPHDGNAPAPLECGIIHVKKTEVPEYAYVANSKFGNPWVTMPILVNGQAFRVPNVVEVFLRRIRDKDSPKHLFFWRFCADAEYAELEDRQSLNLYMDDKRLSVDNASAVLDPFSELESLSEEEMEKETGKTMESWIDTTKACSPDMAPVWMPTLVEYPKGPVPDREIFMPLDRVADEIRIFMLEPHRGDPSSALRGTLYHIPLGCFDKYEALSYTWGDPNDTRKIFVSGQEFEVTSNLHSALLQLRDENRKRVLWIDAICINQKNIAEKNRQIQKMRKIYESALCVLMWLGEAAEESDDIMETLDYYHSTHREGVEDTKHSLRRISVQPDKLGEHELMAYLAVYRLLLRPIFVRVWCIQEQAMARKILVLCGAKCISWEVLHLFASTIAYDWAFFSWLDRKHSETPHDHVFALDGADVRFLRMDTIRDIRHATVVGKRPSLLSLMLSCQNTVSTNPRDKIFGFWGLASDAKQLIPSPDYALSVREIYTQFVFSWIHEYQKLDIICAAQVPRHVTELPDMPTFVPDWGSSWSAHSFITLPPVPMGDTRRDDVEHNSLYSAAGNTKPFIAKVSFRGADFDKKHTGIGAAGLICDTIVKVGTPCHYLPATPRSDWFEMIDEHVAANGGAKEEAHEAENRLLRVIIADRDPGGLVKKYVGSDVKDGIRFLVPIVNAAREPSKSKEVSWLVWINHINNMLRGRRFFITKKGYFGLAHRYVEPGARVCVLYGCSVPVLLNRMNNGLFQFLGDCFVDGMMYGEMIEEASKKTPVPEKLSDDEFVKMAQVLPQNIPDEDSVVPRVVTIV